MTFVEFAANRGPVTIVDGAIYVTSAGEATGDKIMLNGRAWPLSSIDAESLWQVYSSMNRQRFEAEVAEKTKSLAKNVSGSEMLSTMLNINAQYINALRSVLFETSLHFMDRDPGLFLGDEPVDDKESVINYLEKRLDTKAVLELKGGGAKALDIQSFGNYFLKNLGYASNTLFMDGRSYALPNTYDQPMIVAGMNKRTKGRTMDIRPSDVDKLLESYFQLAVEADGTRRLSERMKNIEETEGKEAKILASALARGTKGIDISLGDWGVILKEDRIVAYLKIKEYVLRDWLNKADKKYYVFPETTVGVHVFPHNPYANEPSVSKPVILNDVPSPFSHGERGEAHICMGAYGKYRDVTGDMRMPDKVATYMLDAKKVLTTGYSSVGYGGVSETLRHFTPITMEEIASRKIPVTNETAEGKDINEGTGYKVVERW